MFTRILIVAASLAIGGCSTLSEYGSVRKENVKNAEGHVIGHRQLLRNESTGEVIARVALYTPLRDASGTLIGYEETAKGGSVIRDLDGYAIGGRFTDLRSRATNTQSKGLMIVFRPRDAQPMAEQPMAVAQPVAPRIWELMASLTASDLRRLQ